jgi:uncharacterized protein (DUF2147 family)
MRVLFQIIIRIAVAILMMVLQNRVHAATATDPGGTFLTEDGRARVRIERCGSAPERICGYIVWMKEAVDARGQPLPDKLNPDPARRSRPLLGHQLILGLKPSPEGRFAGEIYNAEDGRTYGITIWRETTERLKVKGCLLGMFCSTQSWTLANNAAPGQLLGVTGDAAGPTPEAEWAAARPARPEIARMRTR